MTHPRSRSVGSWGWEVAPRLCLQQPTPWPRLKDSHCGNYEHPVRVSTSRFRVGCQQRDIFSCSPRKAKSEGSNFPTSFWLCC
ncbi:hypothetical protein CapIbe_001818 [Capra ibex]